MTPTPDDQLVPRLTAAREVLLGVAGALPSVGSDDLAELAALTAGVVAAAHAAQAAVVLESEERGVIAGSDHPRVADWVAQSQRDADVPVTPALGRAFAKVAKECSRFGLKPLREALTSGHAPVEAAAYSRLQSRIDVDCWDDILAGLIGWAGEGAARRDLAAFEEAMVGQFGTAAAFEEREQQHHSRDFSAFMPRRDGTLEARIILDAFSEATLSAAITALSAPTSGSDGELDLRTAGQRRADALLTLASMATRPDKRVPGSGAKARVVVTIALRDLLTGLGGRAGADWLPGITLDGFGGHGSHPGHSAQSGHGGPGESCLGNNHPSEPIAPGSPAFTDASGGFAAASSSMLGSIEQDGTAHASAHAAYVTTRSESDAQTTGFAGRSAPNEPDGHTRVATYGGCGMTGFGQALTPTQVRQLACDAQIIPAVLGTKGEILELGRGKRLATPGLVTYLHQRDRGCSYPGCTMPPSFCEAHHLVHWIRGGSTDRDNMALLCQLHHTTVHRFEHVGEVTPEGVQWRRHDGTPIGNHRRSPAA